MAMGTNGPRGRLMSEINVTPLVDVMLVLLIIFMVTAPLLQEQVSVELPKTKAGLRDQGKESVVLTVDKSGTIFLGTDEVTLEELEEKLAKIYAVRDDKSIYLYADEAVDYGRVVQAMAKLQPLGLRLGIMTEPPPTKGKRR